MQGFDIKIIFWKVGTYVSFYVSIICWFGMTKDILENMSWSAYHWLSSFWYLMYPSWMHIFQSKIVDYAKVFATARWLKHFSIYLRLHFLVNPGQIYHICFFFPFCLPKSKISFSRFLRFFQYRFDRGSD